MTEQCARCGKPMPPPIIGPEGAAEQGWTTYESEQELVVDVPDSPALLPPNVAAAIGAHEGIVSVEPLPEVEAPSIREVRSHYYGVACPGCQAETGWDWFGWCMFMHGLASEGEDR